MSQADRSSHTSLAVLPRPERLPTVAGLMPLPAASTCLVAAETAGPDSPASRIALRMGSPALLRRSFDTWAPYWLVGGVPAGSPLTHFYSVSVR